MLSKEEWQELASNKLELEYENQFKVSKLLDLITEYINKEMTKERSMLNEN